MYKSIKILMVIFSFLVLAAPERSTAQAPEVIIVVPRGLEQRVAVENISGARVGNIHIAHIEQMRPNEVVISATGVGKTSLEVTRRDGATKKFILHVVPHNSRPRTVRPTDPEMQSIAVSPSKYGDIAEPSELTEARRNEPNVVASKTETEAGQPGSTPMASSSAAPPPSTISIPSQESSSILSRLEISTSTILSYDSERIRMVGGNSQALQDAAVRGDSVLAGQNDETITVRRFAVITPFSFVLDLNSRNSVTLSVPYIRRRDEVVINGTSFKTKASGLGDVQLKFDRQYSRLRKSGWDGSLGVNLGLPTGKSVYTIDADESPLGIGHYEIGGNLGVRRVFDPLTFNAAVGLNYYLPRRVEGQTIRPGLGYSMQSGFGYALTDRWVFTEQIEFVKSPNVLLTTPLDAQSVATEQVSLGHSLIYRPKGGHMFQMMFNVGLTPSSSDFGLGFSYSFRRKASTQ